MIRRRLFNFAAAVSLLLCIAMIPLWHHEIQTHLTDVEQRIQQGELLRQSLERQTKGTPAYDEALAQVRQWEMDGFQEAAQAQTVILHPHGEVAEKMRQTARRRLAEQRQFTRYYSECFELGLLLLLVLPVWWLVQRWRQWTRLPGCSQQSVGRVQRVARAVFASLATISALLATATLIAIPRSYCLARDHFVMSSWFDDNGLTYWRQTYIEITLGQIGINGIDQSGPSSTYRKSIENSYAIRGYGIDEIPLYGAGVPRKLNFRFGRDKTRWGVTTGYFAHYRNGSSKPSGSGYEVIAPLWMLEILWLPLPLLWFALRLRTLRRHKAAHCIACGYNLTGNTSGTCPECGTPVPAPADKTLPA